MSHKDDLLMLGDKIKTTVPLIDLPEGSVGVLTAIDDAGARGCRDLAMRNARCATHTADTAPKA